MAADIFNARLAQENVITKTDFDVKFSSVNRNITSNKTKHVLVENEFKKMQTFDSSLFNGQRSFFHDRAQLYLIF